MRLEALDGGRLRMRRRIFVPGADKAEMIDLPVPAYLIRHPDALILFDTGCPPGLAQEAEGRWGGLARLMVPVEAPGQDVVSELAKRGIAPGDIDIVVNSHLHPDHCGANSAFPSARFIAHADEIAWASEPQAANRGYIRSDWDFGAHMQAITGDHDIMGDGLLRTVPLPGHTPGLFGLMLDLPQTGTVLIATDAVCLRRNLENDEVPMNAWDADRLVASYGVVRAHAAAGARIICGHDDAEWKALRAEGPLS
jgi:N-acyl homoserine lactone hydrolase